MKEFDKLVDIISQLREECPWDKEQTHESLSKHLIEEAYELFDRQKTGKGVFLPS